MPILDLEAIAFALYVAYREEGKPAWGELSPHERQDWIQRTRVGLDAAMIPFRRSPADDGVAEGDGAP